MNNYEIGELIKEKQKKIEELIDPTTFVLSKEVNKLYQEIFSLQQQCTHDFKGEICQFCQFHRKGE